MKKSVIGVAVLALSIAACKPKAKDEPKVSCAGVVEAPAAFKAQVVRVSGAVKTESCSVVAVGQTADGKTVVAKYDEAGVSDRAFGTAGMFYPLEGRMMGYDIVIQRVALLPDGILALGWYQDDKGAGDVFAFKLKPDGYPDYKFGPREDGIVRGEILPYQTVAHVEAPAIENQNSFTVIVTYVLANNVERDQLVRIAMNGREAMPVTNVGIPKNCNGLNYQKVDSANNMWNISQAECNGINLSIQGPAVRDALMVVPDGTVYQSGYFGEFSMHYESSFPVLTSRDSLGNVKNEYMHFVKDRERLCGKTVPMMNYLVFSKSMPGTGDYLTNCWFL